MSFILILIQYHSLGLFFGQFKLDPHTKNTDALQNILKWFFNHLSLIKIKELLNNQAKFSFKPVKGLYCERGYRRMTFK